MAIGDTVEAAPPSKVKYDVEMEGMLFVEDEAALTAALVARGSCLQKLVKEGESLKPE